MDEFSEPQKPKSSKAGVIGGICLGVLHLIAAIPGLAFLDYVTMVLSIPIYFFIGRKAAEILYEGTFNEYIPPEEGRNAGKGSLYIAIVISVGVLILRDVLRSLAFALNIISAVSLCWLVPAQIIIGLIFGILGVNSIVKNHTFEGDDNGY